MAENIEATCISSSIKLHLEGALIHYIKKIQEDVATFAAEAVFFKERNPNLSNHYLQLGESQRAFIEELEKAKGVIRTLPTCKES